MRTLPQHARRLFPGLMVCAMTGIAAMFLARQYQAPVMLLALLLGMSLNFLSADGHCGPGIDCFSKPLLRLGVALLGLRITAAQIITLGWQPVLGVLAMVAATIVLGVVLARLLGFRSAFGFLTGGAVAICGASAALAISAALPQHPLKERATLFTVIGVCLLSTAAMIFYPSIAQALGFTPVQAGFFLGGSIHDVAQVVGAGYSLSPATGDAATLIKLLRVATLVPIIALASLLPLGLQHPQTPGNNPARPPLLPWFVLAFAGLVVLNSTGWLATGWVQAGQDASQWLLTGAMAAIGMKTPLKEMALVGWRPMALLVAETLFLAALAGALAPVLTR